MVSCQVFSPPLSEVRNGVMSLLHLLGNEGQNFVFGERATVLHFGIGNGRPHSTDGQLSPLIPSSHGLPSVGEQLLL